MEDPKKERYIYQYAHLETVNCVVKSGCVPCLYKLFPDGGKDAKLGQVAAVALAKQIEASEQLLEQIKIPNNQRPEMCPRAKADDDRKPFTMYCQEVGTTALPGAPSSVLTVGDGDFTFSLSLAKLLCGGNSETEAKVEFTATSHESLQSVLTTYKPHAQETLAALRDLSVTVLHGVDATSLADTPELRKESKKNKRKLDDDGPDSSKIKMKRYDVVIWNFPCISLPAGADGQARELQANKELLAKFFLNVRRCLSKGTGEVHISHKTLEPFSWWGIRQIATDCGFDFAYAVAFDRCMFPGYTNRKALDRKSFPCNDALTYVFVPQVKSAGDDAQVAGEPGEPGPGAATDARAAAERTRLRHLLNHGVLVSLQDRRIARKIWNYLTTTYPAK